MAASESKATYRAPWEYEYHGNLLCVFFGHKWRLMPGYPDHTGDEIFECSRWNCTGWHG